MDCSMPAPCPSLSPGFCSNLCSLSQWCYLIIPSSVALFSSCPQSFPASGSFPMNQFFASGGQSNNKNSKNLQYTSEVFWEQFTLGLNSFSIICYSVTWPSCLDSLNLTKFILWVRKTFMEIVRGFNEQLWQIPFIHLSLICLLSSHLLPNILKSSKLAHSLLKTSASTSIKPLLPDLRGFLGCSSGKESACQCSSTRVQSLGQEDTLEEKMATHSSILARIIPQTEEPSGLQVCEVLTQAHQLRILLEKENCLASFFQV